jgi:protease I
MKTIAIVIPFEDFRDEEYFKTTETLLKGGLKIRIVSNKIGTAKGVDGGGVNTDLVLDKIKLQEVQGVVFIGGPGTLDYLDNEASYSLLREAARQEKLIGAICIAPTILAKSGILNGKKATVWASTLDRKPIAILEAGGAEYINEKVVQDEMVITANGPAAAEMFGQAILKAVK